MTTGLTNIGSKGSSARGVFRGSFGKGSSPCLLCYLNISAQVKKGLDRPLKIGPKEVAFPANVKECHYQMPIANWQ